MQIVVFVVGHAFTLLANASAGPGDFLARHCHFVAIEVGDVEGEAD
jgi:hypothetical protein